MAKLLHCLEHGGVRNKRRGSESSLSRTRGCTKKNAGGLRSIYPRLDMGQLYGDVTIGQWLHNQPNLFSDRFIPST